MKVESKRLEAMILIGGKGTRLGSVVSDRPKPMAEVTGRPFVEWLLLALRAQGIRRIIFNTGYMSEVVEAYFGDGDQWNMEVVYSPDPFPLGTAGAVRHALKQVRSDRFVVMNGDSYCRADVSQLEEMHVARCARASLWLVSVDDCRRYGSVEINENSAVKAFHEKPGEKRAGLINAGVYMMDRKTVELIPDETTYSLETDFFPRLIDHGLYAAVGEGPFLDIGIPEAYFSAGEFFAKEALS